MAFGRRLAVTFGVIAVGLALFLVRPSPTAHYIVILAGCLLAVVMHDRRGYALLRPLTHPIAGVAVAGAFVGAQLGLRPLHTVVDQPVGVMLYSVCVAVLLPAVLSPGPVRWLLSLSPLRFVGERSYALYLLQLPVCWVLLSVVQIPPGNRLFLLVTVTGLVVADVLLRTVERPMIEVGRRLTALRGGRGVDPAAGATAEDRVASDIRVPVGDGAAAIPDQRQPQEGPYGPASGAAARQRRAARRRPRPVRTAIDLLPAAPADRGPAH
jgi:peptidoglycan/LPS O-acetylase OafA/YrhL